MLSPREVAFLNESNAIEGLPRIYTPDSTSGHAEAWLMIKDSITHRDLTLEDIEAVQKLIVGEQRAYTHALEEHLEGAIRSPENGVDVLVGGRATPPHFSVPDLMAAYVDDSNKGPQDGEATITFAAKNHARYEQIHPFADGNGRSGRIIMNALMHKYGQDIIVVKNADKATYFRSLHNDTEIAAFMLQQFRDAGNCPSCENDYVPSKLHLPADSLYDCDDCGTRFKVEYHSILDNN